MSTVIQSGHVYSDTVTQPGHVYSDTVRSCLQ